MQFYDSISVPASADAAPVGSAPDNTGRALAIGTFDGVHRGHEALVAQLKRAAAERGLTSSVLTFRDLPYRFFNPEAAARLLTLPEEKRAAFGSLGPDELWLVPFDSHIARQSADEFARNVLCAKLRVRLLVCGPDFALGAGRVGNIDALHALGAELGFEVMVLDKKISDTGRPISSTRIREAIERGEVEDGARLLGREFTLEGQVVPGQQLGRTIGFPTINIKPHPLKVTPAYGVYAVRVHWTENGEPVTYPAALNIGVRPTVDGTRQQIEFHVLDRSIEIAPSTVRVDFVARLRDEQKFVGLAALTAQLKQDIIAARAALAG